MLDWRIAFGYKSELVRICKDSPDSSLQGHPRANSSVWCPSEGAWSSMVLLGEAIRRLLQMFLCHEQRWWSWSWRSTSLDWRLESKIRSVKSPVSNIRGRTVCMTSHRNGWTGRRKLCNDRPCPISPGYMQLTINTIILSVINQCTTSGFSIRMFICSSPHSLRLSMQARVPSHIAGALVRTRLCTFWGSLRRGSSSAEASYKAPRRSQHTNRQRWRKWEVISFGGSGTVHHVCFSPRLDESDWFNQADARRTYEQRKISSLGPLTKFSYWFRKSDAYRKEESKEQVLSLYHACWDSPSCLLL